MSGVEGSGAPRAWKGSSGSPGAWPPWSREVSSKGLVVLDGCWALPGDRSRRSSSEYPCVCLPCVLHTYQFSPVCSPAASTKQAFSALLLLYLRLCLEVLDEGVVDAVWAKLVDNFTATVSAVSFAVTHSSNFQLLRLLPVQ